MKSITETTLKQFLVVFLIWSLALMPSILYAQGSFVNDWVETIENQEIYFGLGQTELDEGSRENLNDLASKMSQLFGEFVIEVTGHTDNLGDADINLKVSQKRALTVAQYLSEQNLHHHRFLIQAKGKFQPKVSNITEEGRAQNRRVEFKIKPDGPLSLLTDPSKEPPTESFAQVPTKEEEILLHDGVEEIIVEEESLDEPVVIQEDAVTEVAPVEPSHIEKEPAYISDTKKSKTRTNKDYTVVEKNDKRKWTDHAYDVRKKPVEGTIYGWMGPQWTGLQDLNDLGSTSNSVTSQTSFNAGLGWISFLEDDSENVFIQMEGFAQYERFEQNASAGFAQDQNQWTYGGKLYLGFYPIPSLRLALHAGFSNEAYLRQDGGNLDYTADFIGSLGGDVEGVVYRFSKETDIGLAARFAYYDIGLGDLSSGMRYGGGLFFDYTMFRVTFDWSQTQFEALGLDTKYNRYSLYASAYF